MIRWWLLVVCMGASPALALELSAQPYALRGDTFTVRVSGAAPHAPVLVLVSEVGPGPGRCGAGECLSIAEPTEIVPGRREADGTGARDLQYTAARRTTLYLQAIEQGPTPTVSGVVEVVVLVPWGDPDADGVNNRFELEAALDPEQPDTDGDGVLDGEDLWPHEPSSPVGWTPLSRQASSGVGQSLPDPEIEPGGQRITWQSHDGAGVWVAAIDQTTAAFVPSDGRGVLVDTGVLPISEVANGPEWVAGAGGSRVIYGKQIGGVDHVMIAGEAGGGWVPEPLAPGRAPFGSLDPFDLTPRVYWFSDQRGQRESWSVVLGSAPIPHGTEVVWGRWAMGGSELLGLQLVQGRFQVVAHDPFTGVLEQRTHSSVSKRHTFGWYAPELGTSVFLVSTGPEGSGRVGRIDVYRREGAGWVPHDRISGPPGLPFVISPEPVVFDGRSYIVFQASSSPRNSDNGSSQVWLVDIDPDTYFGRPLTPEPVGPLKDPEPAVVGGRLVVYYTVVSDGDRVVYVAETGL